MTPSENREAQIEMPKYRSHKEVWALKIKSLKRCKGGAILSFEDSLFADAKMSTQWLQTFKGSESSELGDAGYLVEYKDGYKSWSPSKAFEEGYTKI